MSIYKAMNHIINRLNAMGVLVREPLLNENLKLAVNDLKVCIEFMQKQKFMVTEEPEEPELKVVEEPKHTETQEETGD